MEIIIYLVIINIAAIFIAQLVLSLLIVRDEELNFWNLGRIFKTELILLLFLNKYKNNKTITTFANVYRVLSVILIINAVILVLTINGR